MRKKLTQEQFIERAIKVHGNKYDYDEVIYVHNRKKVKIWCKKCKKYFWKEANSHLQGQGCPKCAIKKRTLNNTKTQEQFIKDARVVHGDKYGYDKVLYIKTNIEVEIYCKKCQKYFKQKPLKHLQKMGCTTCGYKKNGDMTRMLLSEFIKKAKSIHGNDYGYDRVVYVNNHTNVEIYCRKHKKYFNQSPHSHLSGVGCPICNESKGELEVRKYLEKYNIQYVIQKWFSDCRNKNPLPFDFYLPDYNICIEFQGRQHYSLVNFGGHITEEKQKENLNATQHHDQIKRDYCTKNNIFLLEIPYLSFNNIEEIIRIINTYKEVA